MKKYWLKLASCSIIFIMLTGVLVGCDNGEEIENSSAISEISDISEKVEDLSNNSDISDDATTELSETIEELEKEIERLEVLLSAADINNEELVSKINELEETLLLVENSDLEDLLAQIKELEETLAIRLQIIKDREDYISRLISSSNKNYFESLDETHEIIIDDGCYLLVEPSTFEQNLTIFYPDESSVKIVENFYLRTLKLSPSRNKIIINDFQLEGHTETYLYNIETKENKLLELELPADHAPSFLDWLDDRYLLLVVQLDHGSVVRGGNVYIYDSQTGEYAMIIERSTKLFQTYKFEMYREDLVVFTSLLYEETLNFTEEMHHVLSYDKIFELYKNKETFDLYTQK